MARLALITGGTRGIGAAVARALKDAGHPAVVNYHADEACAAAFTADTGIPALKWDVSDGEACRAGVEAIEAEHGPGRDPGQQRGHGLRQQVREHDRRPVAAGGPGQSRFRLLHVEGGLSRHDGAGLGPHRPDRLDERPGRPAQPGQLRRRQGGYARLHQGAGAGRGQARDHGQHRGARLRRHLPDAQHAGAHRARRSSTSPRSAAWATKTR